MDRDQIRQELLEQFRLEREVRAQLEGEAAPPRSKIGAWLDSKIATLVVGALITGILVPMFQCTQESLKWSRQNRYDALTRQVADMRESLKQLVAAHALVAEMYGVAIAPAPAAPDRIADLRRRRLQQNAAVAGTFSFFRAADRLAIRDAWQEYLKAGDAIDVVLENLHATSLRPSDEGALGRAQARLGEAVERCNKTYEAVVDRVQSAVEEVQHEGARFR